MGRVITHINGNDITKRTFRAISDIIRGSDFTEFIFAAKQIVPEQHYSSDEAADV